MGNRNNISCLTPHLLHPFLCHSLCVYFLHASDFKLMTKQNGVPIHKGGFGHHLLVPFLMVFMGLGRGICPNQTLWVFFGRLREMGQFSLVR